jgi:hypothetical protein
LLLKSFQFLRSPQASKSKTYKDGFLLLLPLLFCFLFIQLFFLSKGHTPTLINTLNISPEDYLIPLSSPLSSILSVQQWIIRFEKILFPNDLETSGRIFANGCYAALCALVILGGFAIRFVKNIDNSYKQALMFLFAGISLFFIFAYAADTNISYNSRHFKLLGYLCIPGWLVILKDRLPPRTVGIFILAVCFLALSNIYYLKKKWTRNRYIGVNYFYRFGDTPSGMDQLDRHTYQQLVLFDQHSDPGGKMSAIFFIEGNQDLSMDMQHPCIIQSEKYDPLQLSYHGKGPRLLACVSKKTLSRYPDLLKIKFPDYVQFRVIRETEGYRFLESLPEK